MAAHARLKNEFTEDKKYHNLMTWLSWFSLSFKEYFSGEHRLWSFFIKNSNIHVYCEWISSCWGVTPTAKGPFLVDLQMLWLPCEWVEYLGCFFLSATLQKITEKSRVWHNHKPRPILDTKRKDTNWRVQNKQANAWEAHRSAPSSQSKAITMLNRTEKKHERQ